MCIKVVQNKMDHVTQSQMEKLHLILGSLFRIIQVNSRKIRRALQHESFQFSLLFNMLLPQSYNKDIITATLLMMLVQCSKLPEDFYLSFNVPLYIIHKIQCISINQVNAALPAFGFVSPNAFNLPVQP